MSPARIPSSVDFPEPLGPMTPMRSPSEMTKLMFWKRVVAPKRFSNPCPFKIGVNPGLSTGGTGCCDELLVRAFEVFDCAVLEVPDARGNFVDQVVIVCHQEHRALVALDRDVQSVDGLQIKVICRLVEDQDIRLCQHQLAK